MSASLIEHETIKTTVVKAKELRRYVEPLITLSKEDTVANRRRAFSKLRSKSAVGKLFTDLGPRYKARNGGYTRIIKAGFRRGDSAMVGYMQLVDQPDVVETEEDQPIESLGLGEPVSREPEQVEDLKDSTAEEEAAVEEVVEETKSESESTPEVDDPKNRSST